VNWSPRTVTSRHKDCLTKRDSQTRTDCVRKAWPTRNAWPHKLYYSDSIKNVSFWTNSSYVDSVGFFLGGNNFCSRKKSRRCDIGDDVPFSGGDVTPLD
jgi:hypothetical protein